jgi:hypothetical protein
VTPYDRVDRRRSALIRPRTVCIPLFNYILYPFLRRKGINFSPVRRVAAGLLLATLTMAVGAILQWQVYAQSPCGYFATKCTGVTKIPVWVQIPIFSLPAIMEIFINGQPPCRLAVCLVTPRTDPTSVLLAPLPQLRSTSKPSRVPRSG